MRFCKCNKLKTEGRRLWISRKRCEIDFEKLVSDQCNV